MGLENSLKIEGWTCPYCDKLNNTDQEYCPSCGASRTKNVIPVEMHPDNNEERITKFVKLVDGKEVNVPALFINGKWVSTKNIKKVVYNNGGEYTTMKKVVLPPHYEIIDDIDKANESGVTGPLLGVPEYLASNIKKDLPPIEEEKKKPSVFQKLQSFWKPDK